MLLPARGRRDKTLEVLGHVGCKRGSAAADRHCIAIALGWPLVFNYRLFCEFCHHRKAIGIFLQIALMLLVWSGGVVVRHVAGRNGGVHMSSFARPPPLFRDSDSGKHWGRG
jgi:hypothetical protein